jgi:hypothetical protein
MNLKNYFSEKIGLGVISTANDNGEVNGAVYAKPHVLGDKTVAFIMRDRLTRANLQRNGRAHYMFIEHEHGYRGVRLSLVMTEEVRDKETIAALSRRNANENGEAEERFLVLFKVEKSLALIGGQEMEFN